MKALTFGSAMIDVITIVDPVNIERMSLQNDDKSFLLLEQGRKVAAKSITTHVGGGGCNTAVSLARRGWRAAVAAKVGADLNAGAVTEHLEAKGVSADRLFESFEAATGVAVMVASHERNATIFVHRGANETLTDQDVDAVDFSDFDLVYVAPLSSGSADQFPRIVAKAKAAGAMVAANPGIRQLTSRGTAFFDALEHIDLISINRVEAEALVPGVSVRAKKTPADAAKADAPTLMRRGLSFGGFDMGLGAFMRALGALGPRYVLVTDGAEGAYLLDGERVLYRPAVPAEPAGTAGAGDAYCSTLTAALSEGAPPAEAMLEAAVNATAVISVVDTTSGLLSREDLTARAAEQQGLGLMEF
jgi:sugar/nucleoside kinase (ribokinase family)